MSKQKLDYPSPQMKELFKAILALNNEKEAVRFFRDLLTIAELKEFANRWQIVKLLVESKSYGEIATKLKVSTTTVTRVAHWLYHGLGGYKQITDRIFKSQKK